MLKYKWPGNVRELRSVIRQMVLNSTGTVIAKECLPDFVREQDEAGRNLSSTSKRDSEVNLTQFIDRRLAADSTNLYAETLEVMERELLTRVLTETQGNQSRASEILGITRGKVRDRIANYGITSKRV